MTVRLLVGDVRERLADLPAASVQCVVTSPPYYGLRDYGVAGQIGLEPTLAEYVATMVAVFREVRRVLRDDGTVWLNLGDSYAGNRGNTDEKPGYDNKAAGGIGANLSIGHKKIVDGLKPKDLMGVPWRVAFALQDDGWWLRSDIVWAKPNPMPESVTDRPTRAHEYIFLLTKSARYYFDADAVREEAIHAGRTVVYDGSQKNCTAGDDVNDRRTLIDRTITVGTTRNVRSVWTIATHPYPDAHFASFPPAIPERCIKAGTSERGACADCGAPWVRVVERTELRDRRANPGQPAHLTPQGYLRAGGSRCGVNDSTTTGWRPSCSCDAATVPCVVLDPFAGAGTTLLVADRLQRDAVGIELNPTYAEMIERRIVNDAPLFANLSTA